MTTIQQFQLAQVIGKTPISVAPSISNAPYVTQEIQYGDVASYEIATATGFPTPTGSPVLTVGGNVKSTGYVTQQSDVGSAVAVSQTFTNFAGSATGNSNSVQVSQQRQAYSMSLMGGNVGNPSYYFSVVILNNCALTPSTLIAGAPGGAGGTVPLDSNGWPTVAFYCNYSNSPTNGQDGQITAGTYLCSYVSSAGATVTCYSGGTITYPMGMSPIGGRYYYQIVIPSSIGTLVDVQIGFSAGIQDHDIPRDGSTPSSVAGEFYVPALAYFSKFPTLRFMDLCSVNNNLAEVHWSQRCPAQIATTPCPPSPSIGAWVSWERRARFINAIAAYSGSVFTTAKINLPNSASIPSEEAGDYVTSCSSLLQSLVSSNVKLEIEVGNEPWNPGFTATAANLVTALTEAQVVATYALSSPNISSIVGDGAGGAVVTLTMALPPFITNGASMVCVNQNVAGWSAGSIASPATVTTGGALTAQQFKYTPSVNQGSSTMTISNQIAFFFNLSSTLVADGLSFNAYSYNLKWIMRRTYLVRNAWIVNRPNDRFCLNFQEAGYLNTDAGADSSPHFYFAYCAYLSGTSFPTWVYAGMTAPYVTTNGTYNCTASSTTITNVSYASVLQTGDIVQLNGAVTAGATFTGAISGNTLTVSGFSGSRIYTGQYVVYNGSNIALIATYGTGTGGNGTYGLWSSTTQAPPAYQIPTQGSGLACTTSGTNMMTAVVSSSGTTLVVADAPTVTLSSLTSPPTIIAVAGASTSDGTSLANVLISNVANHVNYMRAHIYQCLIWGVRPQCYEMGLDTSLCPTMVAAISTNSQMETFVQNLLDAWFNLGGKETHYFQVCPTVFVPGQGVTCWSTFQRYTDTSSPKYVELYLNYPTRQLNYVAQTTQTGTTTPVAPGTSTTATYQAAVGGSISQIQSTTQQIYWTTNTVDRWVDWLFTVGRTHRMALTVTGSDSAVGTLVDVYIDSVYLGSVTLLGTGAGSSGSAVPAASAPLKISGSFLTSGSHIIRFDFPANRGTSPGILSYNLAWY